MSTGPGFGESGRFSGRKSGKTTEKLNFSLTCSLLSQYLRENGTLGDLSLGMACNQDGKGKSNAPISPPPMMMNFLPDMKLSGETEEISDLKSCSRTVRSMDLFPQQAGFGPSDSNQNNDKIPDDSDLTLATKPSSAQMTIFYAGKALVFDDVPADKAQEVMRLASNGSFNGFSSVSTPANNSPPNGLQVQPSPQTNCSDLPIARKASLHRFLEKRKDRINAKNPYKVNTSTGPPVKPALVFMEKQSAGQPEFSLPPPLPPPPSYLGISKPRLAKGLAWHALNPFAVNLQPFSPAAPER